MPQYAIDRMRATMKLTKEQCEIFLLLRQFQAPGKPAGELCLKQWHFQWDLWLWTLDRQNRRTILRVAMQAMHTVLDFRGGGLQICHWCHRGQRKVGPSPVGGATKRQCEHVNIEIIEQLNILICACRVCYLRGVWRSSPHATWRVRSHSRMARCISCCSCGQVASIVTNRGLAAK